ncbi:MAG: ABC transporter substrate-binding protein [Actinomycetota bacterium]
MTDEFGGLKILASREAAQRITRRHFLAGSAVAVFSGSVLLAACGGDDALNIYNWAEYNDPAIFTRFTEEVGPATEVSIYDNNEQAVAKLRATEGTSGFDIVVPSDVYVAQMISLGVLEPLDLSKIPNFENLEDQYKDQPFDPGNGYSVCKDWGSTGWIYDTTIVTEPITSWKDFQSAAMGVASENTSVLDTPGYLAAIYLWGEGLNWVTEDSAELDATEDFIVNQFAPHIKAFDSYPGINLAQGNYALSQVWNGDARGGLLTVDDPERYVWSIGKPEADIWMDNWCIPQGAPHLEEAHQWINFILDPDVSFQDMQYHGYHPGITGIQDRAESEGLDFLDIIFFDEATVSGLQDNALNSGQERRVSIWEAAKAAAGG